MTGARARAWLATGDAVAVGVLLLTLLLGIWMGLATHGSTTTQGEAVYDRLGGLVP